MRYNDLAHFLTKGRDALRGGPVALVVAEDGAELPGTLTHHLDLGFREVLLFAPDALGLPDPVEKRIRRIPFDTGAPDAACRAVNPVIAAASGLWLYWCYNAEYLFFPFSGTRRVGEMLAFHETERREAMLACVIDLYAGDLAAHPDGVDGTAPLFDSRGYYALSREGPDGAPLDRQIDIFGGLRWRFEEHVPEDRRRIDRIALFRARSGVRLRPDGLTTDAEMNTHSCPWHHNMTAAVASFRAAKALRSNPASRTAIETFRWPGSVPFRWSDAQLLDLGMIDPGQWF